MNGETRRVSLRLDGSRIELAGYEPEATVRELIEEIERFRLRRTELITARCAGCGLCCNQRIPVFAEDMERLCGLRPELETPEERRAFLDGVLEYPEPPDMDAREQGVRDMVRDMGMTIPEATAIYEYNQAEPIFLRHGADDRCVFLRERMCTIYGYRPITCRFYVCNMGDRLSVLQERMVTEGSWHAYRALGWTGGVDLSHNAFADAGSAWDLRCRRFEPDADPAEAEKLFFYF